MHTFFTLFSYCVFYPNFGVKAIAKPSEEARQENPRFLARLVKLFKRTYSSAVIHRAMRIPRLAFHCAMPHIHRQYARNQGRGNSRMDWKTLLAYITGSVDQALLLRNEYLVTENRILRNTITGRVQLTDGERKTLATIGKQLGKQALAEVATIVKPDTILAWHRKLVAQKFDGSPQRKAPGRPVIDPEVEALVVRMAWEDRSWGYDRIVGALANLGYTISAQTRL